MQLNEQTDLAIRLLLHLAAEGPDQWLPIHHIAHAQQVSLNHLVKVASRLTSGGFLESKRGRHGGVRLARAPEAMSVGEVVRYMESGFGLVACQRADETCRLLSLCRLQAHLGRALRAFMAELDGVMLSDCLRQPLPRSLPWAPAEGGSEEADLEI